MEGKIKGWKLIYSDEDLLWNLYKQRTLQKGGYRGYKRLYYTDTSNNKQPKYRNNRKHSKGGKSTANKT